MFISDLAHNGAGLDKDQSATLGRYAALASSLLTANKALDVTYTNLAASNAISNNFLLPDQKQELAKKLIACGEDTACKDVVTKPYKEISDKKDAEFQKAYAACKLGLGCETFYAIHYGLRLEVTKEGNEYYKNHAADFIQLPEHKAIYHTFVTDRFGQVVHAFTQKTNYTKYIHPVLGYEIVLDESNSIVTNPVNAGTYNFYNPGGQNENSLLSDDTNHTFYDIAPYTTDGNVVNEKSDMADRTFRFLIWVGEPTKKNLDKAEKNITDIINKWK